jgi:hypothetical protein
MGRGEMLRKMSSRELSEWMVFHSLLIDEQKESELEDSVRRKAEAKQHG